MESIPRPYRIDIRSSKQHHEPNKKRYKRLIPNNEIYIDVDDVRPT